MFLRGKQVSQKSTRYDTVIPHRLPYNAFLKPEIRRARYPRMIAPRNDSINEAIYTSSAPASALFPLPCRLHRRIAALAGLSRRRLRDRARESPRARGCSADSERVRRFRCPRANRRAAVASRPLRRDAPACTRVRRGSFVRERTHVRVPRCKRR